MWRSSEHSKIAGSYELKNTLGKGHFAVVKLAHHVFTGEKVAVKVIDKTKMDQISTDHLYHEVTCMKLVQHPNVVRLYQVIETPSKLYLILELGDGGDMFDYIMKHDQGLQEDQAKEYFAQIVSAIAYCHKLHVVHRDLKPENVVFFESQGLVKLTDFGFSNQYQPGEKLSTSCGSLAYSAPEILLGEEYDAPAVDVWSLGVILYMLVCGIAPFNEANDSETLVNIMECRFTILDHVSEECSDLIKRMIIREPNDRIGLDEIVSHPWLKGVKSLSRARRNSTPILAHSKLSEELHNSIISTMVQANLGKRDDILAAIREKRYDHVTSTYFLLAERALLNQVSKKANTCIDELNIGDFVADKGPTSMSQMIPNKLRPLHPEKLAQNFSTSALAASPPCKQSTLTTSEDFNRRRTASSSSEEGSSFFDRKSSYIREHLTITPRKGFSVAHGGIDMLIEEEERSRSQTTTDDEGEACEDIPLNPNTLASHLQRTSLQKNKRIQKKRKSTPVLNEICEETELENDSSDLANTPHHHISPIKENASPGKHFVEDGNPTTLLSGVFDVFMGKKFLPKTIGNNRTGRTHHRRKSHKSSGSETSDDESGSRRESRTNLSAAVSGVFFQHRRDSDDRDHDDNFRRPNGGGSNRETFQNIAEESQVSHDCEKENDEGSEMGQGEHQDSSGSQKTSSLNNNNVNLPDAFLFNRNQANLNQSKIVNILVPRSRSAESRSSSYSIITSSRSSRSSSSARSSCSSLSTSHQLRSISRKSRRATKNSSSTRSDTGLVLRCHVNNTKMKCTCGNFRRSSSSSSIRDQARVRVCSSMVNIQVTQEDFGTLKCNRSCSLPRQSRKLDNVTEVETKSKIQFPSCDNGESWNTAALNNEAISIKRSNLSLVSSTCSGSKFVIDPVNELSRSPSLMPLPEVETQFISSKNEGVSSPKQLISEHHESVDQPVFMIGGKSNILTKLNNLNQQHRKYQPTAPHVQNNLNRQRPKYKTENVFVRRVKHQDCCLVM